jgi:hypothetical protein
MQINRTAGVIFGALALLPGASQAAVFAPSASYAPQTTLVQPVQHWGNWGGRPWGGWRGRPYWFARPWARRPYYGTVIAGVALGALVTVAVVGAVPPRPAPNLCWYWADPYRSRGYWDYCY